MLQFGASLTDNTSIIIYDPILFMIQATAGLKYLADCQQSVKWSQLPPRLCVKHAQPLPPRTDI